MPQNKRESLIYTVMMCCFMVLWMSIYNVSLHSNGLTVESIREGWLGFPLAFVFAMCCDWFIVSKYAKKVAFQFLLKADSSNKRKIIVVSLCMVVPMVFIMSLFGAVEVSRKSGIWSNLFFLWMTNIPKNVIMALPLQLFIAGPIVRRIFRKAFPIGKVLA